MQTPGTPRTLARAGGVTPPKTTTPLLHAGLRDRGGPPGRRSPPPVRGGPILGHAAWGAQRFPKHQPCSWHFQVGCRGAPPRPHPADAPPASPLCLPQHHDPTCREGAAHTAPEGTPKPGAVSAAHPAPHLTTIRPKNPRSGLSHQGRCPPPSLLPPARFIGADPPVPLIPPPAPTRSPDPSSWRTGLQNPARATPPPPPHQHRLPLPAEPLTRCRQREGEGNHSWAIFF